VSSFSAISQQEYVTFDEMMKMMMYTLFWTKTISLIFSVSSLKQQSKGRHVAPHRHIMMIQSKLVFAFTP